MRTCPPPLLRRLGRQFVKPDGNVLAVKGLAAGFKVVVVSPMRSSKDGGNAEQSAEHN